MIENGEELDDRQEYCYAKELYCLRKYNEAILCYTKYIEKYLKDYKNKRNYVYSSLLELADCYRMVGKNDERLNTLLVILKNEVPPSECCCKIGEIFLEKKDYEVAKYWFEQAIQNKKNVEQDGDSNIDYNEFIPYIDLCVCYFWLGDLEKSYECNEKAGKIKPNDTTYLFNKNSLIIAKKD